MPFDNDTFVVLDLPEPVASAVMDIRRRLQADSLRSQVAEETRRTAAELRRVGLSTRDVGEILGISGTRVAQIERERVPA